MRTAPIKSSKMLQPPMISSPLKQTNEIDWIYPLKTYIRQTYGDDPERYAEECNTLNRLRQDMRGAGKDSTAGRDLLYRYYGQLELLDLRFPVDENHIKISFTWYVLHVSETIVHIVADSLKLLGSMPSLISLPLSTHLPMKKLPLYLIFLRCFRVMLPTKTASTRLDRKRHTTRSRQLLGCSLTSTRISCMRHRRI